MRTLSALRDWARDSPTMAVPGIARCIIRSRRTSSRTPDTLEAMRDERLVLAHSAHLAAGGHR
ncbi:hypothetical protein [Streptomyces sp. Ru71]|uniref:hypothetical protein n=1 Tax=Streptomyces sp. Ru71 TaxID=2080746 RepID=UPI0015E3D5A5|nr:hypothetical protein [Streptomyces sp. Ru71]